MGSKVNKGKNMKHISPQEGLLVYEKALLFVRDFSPQLDLWPAACAVRDQMDRACESLVVNLMKGAWHQRTEQGVYHLECSLGSVLECAACLDIAFVKGLLQGESAKTMKVALEEIARMEVGLRRSWYPSIREEPAPYSGKTTGFPHESLQVYQRGLQLCQVLVDGVLMPNNQQGRYARRIDEASTSMLLNIAEGNGRFSRLDHRQFITSAEEAGVKLTAYLDLIEPKSPAAIQPAKALLREVMAMLEGMRAYLEAK